MAPRKKHVVDTSNDDELFLEPPLLTKETYQNMKVSKPDTDKIITVKTKKDKCSESDKKEPRKPNAFNLFVRETMLELKNSGMSAKEKLAECARLWRLKKELPG